MSWKKTRVRLAIGARLAIVQVGDWIDGPLRADIRATLKRMQELERERDEQQDTIDAQRGRLKELQDRVEELKRNHQITGRTIIAESRLARVVEALERCQCNTGECPCSYIALAAAKGK